MPIFSQDTVLGKITISERHGRINGLYFGDDKLPERALVAKTITLEKAFKQLDEYLAGRRKKFYLELAPVGTEFMHSVWQELLAIPYAETRTFLDVARSIKKPTATRAVGRASDSNPIPIFIPCHRLIGTDGSLVGYAGGLDNKKKLLEIENLKMKASCL